MGRSLRFGRVSQFSRDGISLVLAPESRAGPPTFFLPPSFPDPTALSPLISSGGPTVSLRIPYISSGSSSASSWVARHPPYPPPTPTTNHHQPPNTTAPLHPSTPPLYTHREYKDLGGKMALPAKKSPAPGVPSGLATRLDREGRRQSPAPIISASKAEKEDKGLTQKGLLVWKGIKWNEKCFSASPKS